MANLKARRDQAKDLLIKAKDRVERAQENYWQLQGMVMILDDLIVEEERNAATPTE